MGMCVIEGLTCLFCPLGTLALPFYGSANRFSLLIWAVL